MERKVLFTASTYSHIANFHRPYLRAFSDLGWTVDVACGGPPGELPEARRVIQLPFEKSIAAPANFQAARLLRREMQQEKYDLISTHTSLAAFFTRLAAKGMDTVVVNTSHGYLFDENTPAAKRTLLLQAEKLTAKRTDLLLTMNRCDYEIARRYRLGRRIIDIPGVGVDFSRLDSTPADAGAQLRVRWNLPADAFVLIYPAEFSSRKNQAMLLQALSLLPRQVHLLLPGEGALLEGCKALAKELGIGERVCFPGHVSDMGAWYRAANCAVSASRSEGLPFNVMEAMHCGLPVVASAVKGHEDLIQDGKNGFLFPWNDAKACAARIETLAADPALSLRLGAYAAETADQYGLDAVLPKVMAAYETVSPALASAGRTRNFAFVR